MENAKFAKQTLDFQKTMFDNSYSAMIMVQDQSEKMLNNYLEKLPWVTAESKSSLQSSIDLAKQTRDDFKKVVEDSFSKFEEMLEN